MATYVLLHGAYQGGWIWQRVTPHLRAAGHSVFAPTLDGCAERRQALRPGIDTESQAEEVSKMLFFEDLRDVVLVGTSCGGMVAARVAETTRERIGRIVLADALAPVRRGDDRRPCEALGCRNGRAKHWPDA
jgi:pimeloyl-ACP methyl ester carboxylesterase